MIPTNRQSTRRSLCRAMARPLKQMRVRSSSILKTRVFSGTNTTIRSMDEGTHTAYFFTMSYTSLGTHLRAVCIPNQLAAFSNHVIPDKTPPRFFSDPVPDRHDRDILRPSSDSQWTGAFRRLDRLHRW